MSGPATAARVASALFEVHAREPSGSSRLVLRVVIGLFAILLGWSVFAKLDIVAVAEGRLVPETYVKIVQPAEAGIVREILVNEGQAVRKGEVLVRLDPTIASSDRRSVSTQVALKKLQIRRIDAQLAGRQLESLPGDDPPLLAQIRLDGHARERSYLDQSAQEEAIAARFRSELAAARETLIKLERTLPSYQQSAQAYETLSSQKLVGSLEAETKKREAVEQAQDLKAQTEHVSSLEASLDAQDHKVRQLKSSYLSALQSERSEALGELNQYEEQLRKQGFREGLLELRAPQDGIVKDLATTTLGAVIEPGVVLLSVVPKNEPLLAEIYIRNDDVGFVRSGQTVRIKLAAYTFTRYGMLEGTVRTISPDSNASDQTSPERVISPFKAIIQLNRQDLDSYGMRLPLVAGMQLQAEIQQGERTVMEYLLSPVRRIAHEAGGER